MRRAITVAAVLIAGALGASAAAASPLPRLLAWPCHDEDSCHQQALYRPTAFLPGANYSILHASWINWGPDGAAADVTVRAGFTGTVRTTRSVAVFYHPARMCGVLTFTLWVDTDGEGGKMVRYGQSCFFVPTFP